MTVNMLLGAFNPLQALAMTLMINARHLFYGISMLDKYKGTGWKKFYLIFGMCDESFSINYTADIPENVDRGWFMFFVTLLNHFYWFFGSTLGGIFGSLIHFNTEGLDFVMVTDILEESTILMSAGEDAEGIISRAFSAKREEHGFLLKGVVSRKKQLIPALIAAMQE